MSETPRVFSLNGRPYYQGNGQKHFFILGNPRSRQAARLEAAAMPVVKQGGSVNQALLERYAGRAHPKFIEQFAHILGDRPKMTGWKAEKPTSRWTPEEHAAYLRDGSPKNMEDIVRIMGTVGNPREY